MHKMNAICVQIFYDALGGAATACHTGMTAVLIHPQHFAQKES